MADPFDIEAKRTIRAAMARDAYRHDSVRMVDADIAGHRWLVATTRGLFAVSQGAAKCVVQGWFFGICRHADHIYLFENCALRDRSLALGRIIRLTLAGDKLGDPAALAKGLHAGCHQLAMIDGLLCLVDSHNQQILRFGPDGAPVDVKVPFGVDDDNNHHINSIAKVGGRIAIMLHNGRTVPETCSELAWLDARWNAVGRTRLPGFGCHDIVEDRHGTLWHSASMSGEIIASDGRRVKVTPDRMTRGLALAADGLIVGVSSFGPRQNRDALPGAVVILDATLTPVSRIELDAPPTDILAI